MTAPEEQFREGITLINPANGFAEWQRGIRLVEAASAQGLVEATERRAIFECKGIGRPMNWERALDFLALAAEQGSTRAAEQLELMAGKAAGPQSWKGLRAQISVDRLLNAAPVQLASVRPRIGVIKGFATQDECGWLIRATGDLLERSKIYDIQSGLLREDPQRTNRAAPCNPLDVGLLAEVMRARLSRAIGLPLPNFEGSQVLHYFPGEEFKPHHDYFEPNTPGFQPAMAAGGQRVATQLIYLNEEFEGGETDFPSLGLAYRGRTGDALMFFNIDEKGQPEPLTLHTGRPPTSGEKWIFSQWVRERPI